jgi:homoserine dehydrogenase
LTYNPSLRVALAGFGTVGQAVARRLASATTAPFYLTHICVREPGRKQVDWVPAGVRWTDRFDEVLASDADVVVELIGGLEPARDWIRAALGAGKSVVTANKQLMAREGPALLSLAARRQRTLRYEAAVAGAVPVLRALQDGLAGDRVSRIEGVLNGTSNYILTRIERDGIAFEDALREAQSQGLAEADPSADVDGSDAQAKLAILATVAFHRHVPPEEIALASIRGVCAADFVEAKRRGCTIRQVSAIELTDGGAARGSVGPVAVPEDSWLARAAGSHNVVTLHGAFAGPVTLAGAGAGGDPTAVAVLSDLLAIARAAPPAVLLRTAALAAPPRTLHPTARRTRAVPRIG